MCADQVVNTNPTFTSSHTFSTDDITGTFDGLTQGTVGVGETPVIDFSATPMVTKEGVELYPINSEFGFIVDDFNGAVPKDFVDNPEYEEGFAGDLKGEGGEQVGLVISDAPTDVFMTPALLGTWLMGIGGSLVKASTEHYSVMQDILSDQAYPGDPLAEYPLDDDLIVIGGQYDGMRVADVIPIVGDVNGDGFADIKDVLTANESTITENIAVSSDYSVTLKDDGKLLYRWGNAVKRPNDVRIEATLDLPEEWTQPDAQEPDLMPLYRVTAAELVVNHTVTNNPNDQIRPEDYENESAIGQLPTYEILPDGKWVSTDDYYAGDGTFYPAGTVLKDPALAAAAQTSDLAAIGALSSDLAQGYTAAWYTTMDREPFEAALDDNGDYIVGPRWRLQTDKYGQDLPSVTIPLDPSLPPPPTKDEVKYNVGDDTTTVINLLDWAEPISPLSLSAGYQNLSGTTSINGLNMTDGFDVAFYIKGDIKPATIYDTQLVMTYEQLTIYDAGVAIAGTGESDYLVGQGDNTFTGGAGEDLFVLSYGVSDEWTEIQASTVTDFEVGTDTLGIIDFDINELNFSQLVQQAIVGGNLEVSVGGILIATLTGVTEVLDYTDFIFLDRVLDETLVGTVDDNYLVGDQFANVILGGDGNDTLLGLAGDDQLFGEAGDDSLVGGNGDDTLNGGLGSDTLAGGVGTDAVSYMDAAGPVGVRLDGGVNWSAAWGDIITDVENVLGSAFDDTIVGNDGDNLLLGNGGNDTIYALDGADTVVGGEGDDMLYGQGGDDMLMGGLGADTMVGGAGNDTVSYEDASNAVGVRLDGGVNWGAAAGDVISVTENLTGSAFDDTLVGSIGANLLEAGDGNDTVYSLVGNDTVNGGAGDDMLYGQGGSDTFVFDDAFGNDVIADFNAIDTNEKIDLSSLSTISSYSDMTSTGQLYQVGADVIINDFSGNTITLMNVQITDLDATDFIF